jgi:hypothetical protein
MPEGKERIDAHRAARGQVRTDKGDSDKKDGHRGEGGRVATTHRIEHRFE